MEMTMPQLFFSRAASDGERVLQMEKDSKGKFISYTYAQVAAKVRALALSLMDLGLDRGDLVGHISDNRADWLVADLAIQSCGAANVPRGRDSMAGELSFILSTTESRIVFVENAQMLDKILSIRKDLPAMRTIVVTDGSKLTALDSLAKDHDVEILLQADLVEKGMARLASESSKVDSSVAAGRMDELATVIFTSGTTGEPKGVMLTQSNLNSIAAEIDNIGYPIGAGQRWLSVLPVWHSFERILQYAIIYLRSTIAYSKPIGKILLNDLQRVNPHIMGSVPRIWETVKNGVYAQMKSAKPVVRGLFNFFVGVGKARMKYYNLFHGLTRDYRKRSRIVSVLRSFLPLAVLTPLYKLGDALVFRKIKTKLGNSFVVGISGGGSLPQAVDEFFQSRHRPQALGEEGARYPLSVREDPAEDRRRERKALRTRTEGRALCEGTSGDEGLLQETRAHREGHRRGGMVQYRRVNGEYSIVGRAKDTIVLSGGENVEPVPIEETINDSPYVAASVVVGQDRKYLSALVVIDQGMVERYLKDSHIYYTRRRDP